MLRGLAVDPLGFKPALVYPFEALPSRKRLICELRPALTQLERSRREPGREHVDALPLRGR